MLLKIQLIQISCANVSEILGGKLLEDWFPNDLFICKLDGNFSHLFCGLMGKLSLIPFWMDNGFRVFLGYENSRHNLQSELLKHGYNPGGGLVTPEKDM